MLSSCTEIIDTISPEGLKDPIKAFRSRLAKSDYSLLVLDNVSDPNRILEFLPHRQNGNILITTKDSAMAGSGHFPYGIQLSALTRTQSMLLFALNSRAWTAEQSSEIRRDFEQTSHDSKDRLPTSIAAVFREEFDIHPLSQLDNIGILTGDLPLAIAQCASYLREYPMPYARYLSKFNSVYAESRRRFLNSKMKGVQYDKSIMTTWDITFDELETTLPNAARMLTLFGFLSRTDISEEFLENALSDLKFWGGLGSIALTRNLRDDLQFLNVENGGFDESLGKLSSLSLMIRSSGIRRIIVHPLIHEWIHLRMGDADCVKWSSRVLMLLYSRLPPLLYSTSDRETPRQADVVLCHVERMSTMVELYYNSFSSLAPECALFFLEAYLWYRGKQYLDVASRFARNIVQEHRVWVQRLIQAAFLIQIIQDFQADPNGELNHDHYQHYLDTLSSLASPSHRPPQGSRFVLTEAVVAYRLYETLDQEVHVFDQRYTGTVSAPLISKATRALLGSTPTFAVSEPLGRTKNPSRLDNISAAVFAYCGARDLILAGEARKAYELLNNNREAAALGVCYGISEMRNYFKALLQATKSSSPEAKRSLDTVMYIDDLAGDNSIVTEWHTVVIILTEHRRNPGIKRFLAGLATRPEFLPCLPSLVMFDDPAEAEDWLERRLVSCRNHLGHASRTTYNSTMHLAEHYLGNGNKEKAQVLCKQGFDSYKATGKLHIRDGYDPYWPESLFGLLTRDDTYDSPGVESLCGYMVSVFTGYDQGSYTDKQLWATRLNDAFKRRETHEEQEQLAHQMLEYLGNAEADDYRWQYTQLLDMVDEWGSAALSLLPSSHEPRSSALRIEHQTKVLAMYQSHRPFKKSSKVTNYTDKWATRLAQDLLVYDDSWWKDFVNGILSDFEDDLGINDSICHQWSDKIWREINNRAGILSSPGNDDLELDRALSLPTYDIQDWTNKHIRLCRSENVHDAEHLKRAFLQAGFDKFDKTDSGDLDSSTIPDDIILPLAANPRQCRLPFGKVIGKRTSILLAL